MTIAASDEERLTATFQGVPASHTGAGTFTFELSFSEPVATSYRVLRDEALQATGGTVRRSRRVNGRSDLWEIHVQPASKSEVVVVLPPTVGCAAPAAVCTSDGKPLSNRAEARIPGPANSEVSIVATGGVTEGTAATFTLARTEPTTDTLKVEVSVTETGAMLASGSPTSMAFGAGETETTLAVATDDDTVVEPASEIAVSVVAGAGYTVASGAGSGQATVEDNDTATFAVSVDPAEVAEGESATVTAAISNGVTFTADQAIELTFSGTASEGTDYSVSKDTLRLLAGTDSVEATVTALDDAEEEDAETVTVAALHEGSAVGSASWTIAANDAPLTASFEAATLPEAHAGSGTFTLRVAFSEAIATSGATLTGESLEVTDGTVQAVRQVAGRSDLWEIEIAPASEADVVIVLAADRACEAAGAVCTEDGRGLSNRLEATISGPELAEVSIEAGTGPVAEGTAADFTLTRTGATAEALTVAVSVTESGAMLASSPPVAVTFGAGESSAELSVATEDDTVVEAASALTAAIADGEGYAVSATSAGSAQVTVEDNEDNDEAQRFAVSLDVLGPDEGTDRGRGDFGDAGRRGGDRQRGRGERLTASFARDQATFTLDFAGSTATQRVRTSAVSPESRRLTLLAGAPATSAV